MKKSNIGLSVLVVTLALLVAVSFVAISHLLIKSGKENPSASLDISVSDNDGNNDSDKDKTESAALESVKPEPEQPTPEAQLIGRKGGG